MNTNIEYKQSGVSFPIFFDRIKGKIVTVFCDVNTAIYAKNIVKEIEKYAEKVVYLEFPDKDLVPSQEVVDTVLKNCENSNYALAVGSGSLNDVCKLVGTTLNIDCGCLATAASMDGYLSKGSAIMRNGKKVTDVVKTPTDILVDLEIIKNAPRIMTAAGFGDIIGKYTCMTDWQLSNIINGEEINQEAFNLMLEARSACVDAFNDLVLYKAEAVAKLMNALLTAGTSMAICGNSRPASGSEHHQSHFLEMDFVARGETIPAHGIKVAIGTLVSIELYNYLKDNNVQFKNNQEVFKLVDNLPKVETVKYMLEKMGCPTKFGDIGVRREAMIDMLKNAHTVRDRYTILTLISELNLTEQVIPVIMAKYF